MRCSDIKVIKKDGTREDFNVQKVVVAVNKSANRAMITFSRAEINFICQFVEEKAEQMEVGEIPIAQMHNIVEGALERVNPLVAKSYRDYRNYKQDFVQMLDEVYKKSQSIMYIGDKENSNTDSALVSTKRSLIFNELNKSLYQKFFMTVEELQACRDGYLYIHDMSARRDTMNCCLFDVQTVLTGGFEMGNLWYNEPKTLDVAFDVIGDIVLSAASQQYGGFTVPSVENILAPYAEKSYEKYIKKYTDLGISEEKAKEVAWNDVQRDMEQGFQGWEYKFNSVSSSRGDYPFITMTAGTGTSRFAKMATITMLNVRRKGQGKKDHKKPVLFPKLVFLYDENLHGPGKELEDVFEAGMMEISDEDILAENQAVNRADDGTLKEIQSLDGELESAGSLDAEAGGETQAADSAGSSEPAGSETEAAGLENPGEAVLTGGTSVSEYIAGVQLSREQIRAKNKETLMELINNGQIPDTEKQAAIQSMIRMTEISEKENAAETLLRAKGFVDPVVSITEDQVDVVVNAVTLTDPERAQIEDIVKRKTEVGANGIVITLMDLAE